MFNINKKKEITLKDVDDVVLEWRKACETRGEIAVGLYGFVSIDPEKGSFAEDNHRVFGDSNMIRGMLKFLNQDLDKRERAARHNEKCADKHVHA